MKVKTILIAQPEPKMEHSPYTQLVEEEKVKIDFKPFIHVESVTAKAVRQQKINLNTFTAIILTSRNAVDHFFRIAEEMRFKVPNALKYFCQSEAVAYYLQKYVVYRKRRTYIGQRTFNELLSLVKKHKNETFLFPSSNTLAPSITQALNALKIRWKQGIFYKTVTNDLSDLKDASYDILVFFSPSGIDSLLKNFPDFKQNDVRIAVFGSSTMAAAKKAGLRVDIKAPTPETSSMTTALQHYIIDANK